MLSATSTKLISLDSSPLLSTIFSSSETSKLSSATISTNPSKFLFGYIIVKGKKSFDK